MRCFLKDADARQDGREIIRNWLGEIREAAYDAEDIIETFGLKVASRREGGLRNTLKIYACILDEAKNVHKVGSQIEEIKGTFSGLANTSLWYKRVDRQRKVWSFTQEATRKETIFSSC